MARQADHRTPTTQRALLRAGLALTAAGLALGAGGTATAAAQPSVPTPLGDLDVPAAGHALTGSAGYATGPVKDLRLNPLAGTGVDPLDNAVGTQVADFKPVSTAAATGPLSNGDSLGDLPVVGPVTGALQ